MTGIGTGLFSIFGFGMLMIQVLVYGLGIYVLVHAIRFMKSKEQTDQQILREMQRMNELLENNQKGQNP